MSYAKTVIITISGSNRSSLPVQTGRNPKCEFITVRGCSCIILTLPALTLRNSLYEFLRVAGSFTIIQASLMIAHFTIT